MALYVEHFCDECPQCGNGPKIGYSTKNGYRKHDPFLDFQSWENRLDWFTYRMLCELEPSGAYAQSDLIVRLIREEFTRRGLKGPSVA